MNPSASPARLHVLMAREAPFGLILRRGPRHQVCTIGWNRTDDTFALGQWLRARISELESDLSPMVAISSTRLRATNRGRTSDIGRRCHGRRF